MKKYIFLFALLIIAFLPSCKKDTSKQVEPEEEVSGLTSEQAAVLDTIPHIDAETLDVVLTDGTKLSDALLKHPEWFAGMNKNDILIGIAPTEIKRILLLRFFHRAKFLTKKSNFKTAYESPYKPAQFGLVYALGGKTVEERTHPDGACKDWHVYGLDCSGFLYQVLLNSGLDVKYKKAIYQADPSYLQNALDKISPNGFSVQVFPRGTKLESGDIVFWSRLPKTNEEGHIIDGSKPSEHIGLALTDGSAPLLIFQSNGSEAECEKNLKPGRGPNALDLKHIYWFHKSAEWRIIRIIVKQTPPPPPPTYKIGDTAFGGIIFYIDQTGQHGMVRSLDILDTDMKWDDKSVVNSKYVPVATGATGTELGEGRENTNKIIKTLGEQGTYAAKVCRDYTGAGYHDWYLPSIIELAHINATVGDLLTCESWSSTETVHNGSPTKALKAGCSGDMQREYSKNHTAHVVAVRNF